jgi:transposase
MARKVTLNLLTEDRVRLMGIVARNENWRERERAQTLLFLDDGFSLDEVSVKMGIHIRTVGFTRLDWISRRFESLVDRPRTGAPSKISAVQLEKIVEAACAEPLTAKALLAKHVDAGGVAVHVNTLVGTLKLKGFVWKRTRHSLKKKE